MNRSRTFSKMVKILFPILVFTLILLTSCMETQTGPLYYNAGANDLNLTAAQITQYNLYIFNTSNSEHTLTFPNASDIISVLSVPVGTFTAVVVTADGGNDVKIAGGTNVIVKPSAGNVAADTTKTLFITITDLSSGNQTVTIY